MQDRPEALNQPAAPTSSGTLTTAADAAMASAAAAASPSAVSQAGVGIPEAKKEFTEELREKPERIIAPAASLALHLLFLIIAALLVIRTPKDTSAPISYNVNLTVSSLGDSPLNELDDQQFNSQVDTSGGLLTSLDMPVAQFNADISGSNGAPVGTGNLAATSAGTIQAMGGAGEGVDPGGILGGGGGGGGGGTSFFGIASRGRRFVYIVDISGSMATEDRIVTLRQNLIESINSLPEQSTFLVIAFNDQAWPFDGDYRWFRADKNSKMRAVALASKLESGGGTNARPAFDGAFTLKPRPDVIYFMTDGQDTSSLPEYIANQLNNKGRKVRINTIAFGDQSGEAIMKRIADDSGGTYRFVPSSPGRQGGP